jgi:hypothetical protein
LDNVAIYSVTLSATRIQAHYTAGSTVVGRLNGRVRIELEAIRDSLISYQSHNITTDRAGYGYNYGKYYGGI